MLAMGEVVALAQENFFWEFPNLGPKEDLNCQEKYAKMNNNNDDDDRDGDGGGGDSEEVVVMAAPPSKGRRKKKRDKDDKEMACDEHEMHIWTERERRKKMRSMFANLHALLPHLPPKADKTTIVDEAVNHIKKLQVGLEDLKNKKVQRLHGPAALTIQSREAFLADQCSPVALPPARRLDFPPIFKTWTSPNVILSLCGNDAHISVCSVKKPGLLHAICFAMDNHKLQIISAQITSDWNRCMYIFHVRANVGSERLIQTFPVEAIYKQAAAEIMLWINS